MKLSVKEIAQSVNGTAKGDDNAVITGAAGLLEASSEEISFLKDAKKSGDLKKFSESKAGCVFVQKGLDTNGRTVVEVDNPLLAFAWVLSKLDKERNPRPEGKVHPQASVSKSAKIGKNVFIGPACVIEDGAEIEDDVCLKAQIYVGANSKIGQSTILYPNVVIRENNVIGKRCVIHSGAVIGTDGYGFYFEKGKHNKIPQVGNVIVEDEVEIGSCSTIDRATTGSTIIRKGAKIDNLVQVAHNVEIGENSLLVAQVGIAGSSKLGKGVVLAGQVGVADHVNLGDGVQVGAQSGIKDDAPPGAILFGSPAQPVQESIKQTLLIQKLPKLFKEFKNLKEKLKGS